MIVNLVISCLFCYPDYYGSIVLSWKAYLEVYHPDIRGHAATT